MLHSSHASDTQSQTICSLYIMHSQVLYREKYASSHSREILYVKPSDQLNIAILRNNKRSNIQGILTKLLLPKGYPNSVSNDYIAYQLWDTAQAFCSTIMGILATQAVLKGVGVGDQTATPLAATITWVLKDGCGHLGRILFAYSHGSSLDSYSKKWRLFADVLNDAAMCIEIALPLFHNNYTTLALCGSTIMKSIVGVAGGATRVAMTQHHAIRGNMGDVAAKDSAQETAVNLVASITALLIITLMGNSSCSIIFVVMMILHIVFNYLAVRAVCLRTLNEPRFLQVIDSYLKNEVIATPCQINRSEPIIFFGSNLLNLKMCGFEIQLGQSLAHIIQYSPEASYLKKIKEIYKENQYIVLPNSEKKMYVFLKDGASVDDVLRAYFHAVLLATITHAIVSKSIGEEAKGQRPFARICRTLLLKGSLLEPPFELLSNVCEITAREWPNLRMRLLRTGWDISKHLLTVDEWRLTEESECINPKNTLSTQENCSLQDMVTPIPASKATNLISSDTYTKEPNATNIMRYDLPAEAFMKWPSEEN